MKVISGCHSGLSFCIVILDCHSWRYLFHTFILHIIILQNATLPNAILINATLLNVLFNANDLIIIQKNVVAPWLPQIPYLCLFHSNLHSSTSIFWNIDKRVCYWSTECLMFVIFQYKHQQFITRHFVILAKGEANCLTVRIGRFEVKTKLFY